MDESGEGIETWMESDARSLNIPFRICQKVNTQSIIFNP